MKPLKDRYLDATVPRSLGPRPRAGYPLWQRYLAALTGIWLLSGPRPEMRGYKLFSEASQSGGNARHTKVAARGSRSALVWWASLAVISLVSFGVIVSLYVDNGIQARYTAQTPTPAPPPSPAVTRTLVVQPTDAGVGINLATGRVSSLDTGDIGFSYADGHLYIDRRSSAVASLDVTQSTATYQTCADALETRLIKQSIYPYTGQGLCVGTPTGGTAFVGLISPLGARQEWTSPLAGQMLYLHETYWP